MKRWNLASLPLRLRAPEILSTGPDGRAIALELPARESLQEHQVRERAWVTIIAGEVQITTAAGETLQRSVGLTCEFEPGKRHTVHALTDARLLLLLTPWPAEDTPARSPLNSAQPSSNAPTTPNTVVNPGPRPR